MSYDNWKTGGPDPGPPPGDDPDWEWPEDTMEYMVFLDRVEGSELSLIKGPPSWRLVATMCPECLGTGTLKTDGITMCNRCPGTGTIHVLKED